MKKERLSAFTDGVVAVIITIMVLELKPPLGGDLASLSAVIPTFLSYVISFVSVAIYWNNHHHFFSLVENVDGSILWANLNLLFWISLSHSPPHGLADTRSTPRRRPSMGCR